MQEEHKEYSDFRNQKSQFNQKNMVCKQVEFESWRLGV